MPIIGVVGRRERRETAVKKLSMFLGDDPTQLWIKVAEISRMEIVNERC
jgi:hypothetical protein